MADLKKPHAEAAQTVRGVGRSRAPKLTGALSKSVRSSGTMTGGFVRGGNKAVPYANAIHWGWRKHNIEPNPWLSQSAQMSEPQWLPRFLAYLNEVLATINGAGR